MLAGAPGWLGLRTWRWRAGWFILTSLQPRYWASYLVARAEGLRETAIPPSGQAGARTDGGIVGFRLSGESGLSQGAALLLAKDVKDVAGSDLAQAPKQPQQPKKGKK